MLLSAGTIISKCCGAVVYDDDGYHCMKCFRLCEAGGTLGDLYAVENQRRELESSLATTFCALQRERNAGGGVRGCGLSVYALPENWSD